MKRSNDRRHVVTRFLYQRSRSNQRTTMRFAQLDRHAARSVAAALKMAAHSLRCG
jgi:hypothetical protein